MFRTLFSLRQDANGKWKYQKLCMGYKDICVNGGLSYEYDEYINSFVLDESGKQY